MSQENAVVKKDWTDTILNWAAKGAGIFVVIVAVQTIFGYVVTSLDPTLGVTFTTQIWPIPLDLWHIVSLILSAIAVGGIGAWVFKLVDENIGKSRHGVFAIVLISKARRRAVTKDTKVILVVIVLLFVGYAAYQNGKLSTTGCQSGYTSQNGSCVYVTTPGSGQYSYQAPIALAVSNVAGGLTSPSSVQIYSDPTQPAIDNVTLSSGKGTSGLSTYTSGTTVWFKITDATNKLLYWVPKTIPYSSSVTAPASWAISIAVELPPASATITATINSTTEASGALYNVTGQGNTVPTLNVIVQNPTTNTGLMPTPGPDLLPTGNNWELGAYVLLSNDSAYKATLVSSGLSQIARLSNNDIRYYETLPSGPNSFSGSQGSFDRFQNADGTWKGTGGAVTIPLSFNLQGLTALSGQNVTCTVYVYAFTSSAYYTQHGYQFGPSAVLLGTYIINFDA
jgi:hypothetical protein